MVEEHVSEELLGRFIRVEVSRWEARNVVRHLLTGCPECLQAAHRLAVEAGFFEPAGQAYEGVFERALAFASEEEQRLALEKLRGWAQWADLQPLSPQLRFAAVEVDPRCHTFGLYDRLLEAGRWAMRSEPAEAVDVFRLAILVAERLDPARIDPKRIADLRAAAWAQLGNAQRIASDFESARRSFNEAWRVLEEEGTDDSVDRAFIIGLEASYIKDIGEFETAESALNEALQIYKEIGDAHQQGRILLQMGDVIGYANAERALAHIRNALLLIDSSAEPRLELCARHDLAWFLADSGQAEEALAILDRARPLYKRFPDTFTQLRLHWLEAKIAYRLGELPQAESIFGQLWEEFRARNLNQEVVLVSIELAQVLTRKGEPARAAELAAQCFSVMQSWGLHNDALAAWIVFQEALAEGRTKGDVLFAQIGEYFRRHWFRPGRFAT